MEVQEERIEGISLAMAVVAVILDPVVEAQEDLLLEEAWVGPVADGSLQAIVQARSLVVLHGSLKHAPAQVHAQRAQGALEVMGPAGLNQLLLSRIAQVFAHVAEEVALLVHHAGCCLLPKGISLTEERSEFP